MKELNIPIIGKIIIGRKYEVLKMMHEASIKSVNLYNVRKVTLPISKRKKVYYNTVNNVLKKALA